jgi:hypothetical protein
MQPKHTALVFATPRKLPKPSRLAGRVAVLDIAFAAGGTGTSFDKVTEPFLTGLGARLAAWVDHHDHELHPRFAHDPRFTLAKKSEHGACPEMVTPDVVARAGAVDTLVCHDDLDGLYAAAKWLRGGTEPYPGADADARAVDTRIGVPSVLAVAIDHALRARPRDEVLRETIVRFLACGAQDAAARGAIEAAAREFKQQEDNARALAKRYQVYGRAAVVDATGFVAKVGPYDKTLVLLLGQEIAPVAVLYDETTVTLAAPFDSGINFLTMLGIDGGMPTRVSVPRTRLDEVLDKLSRL